MERQAHVWHHVEVEIVWDQALLLVSIDGKASVDTTTAATTLHTSTKKNWLWQLELMQACVTIVITMNHYHQCSFQFLFLAIFTM